MNFLNIDLNMGTSEIINKINNDALAYQTRYGFHSFFDFLSEDLEAVSLQCAEMKEELERLRSWKKQEIAVWGPVIEWGQSSKSGLSPGQSISQEFLKRAKEYKQLQEEVERLRSVLRKTEKVITAAATEAQRTEIHRYLSGGYVEMIEAAAFKDSCGIQQALSGKESKIE